MVENTRRAGPDRFMRHFLVGLDALKPQLACLVLDTITLFYATIIASYCYGQIAYGEERWMLAPWWLLVVISLEIALAWETFGI